MRLTDKQRKARAEWAANAFRTHGQTVGGKRSRTYVSWVAMRRRCFKKTAINYERYGGRGITVCNRWLIFENFLADMGQCPSAVHSLDRIENNGNYEPDNCRWATPLEQGRNSRKCRFLELNGQKRCVSEWAEISGIKPHTIYWRLNRGWPIEKAIFHATAA